MDQDYYTAYPSAAAPAPSLVPTALPAQPIPWYSWRRWGWNFLTFSILLHVLFGVVAAFLIVATIAGKKKPDFQAPGSKGPNSPTRALEHKVSMAKKQSSMSAPPNPKRVTTTSLSRVALPSMPAMPQMAAAVVPATMSGMAGNIGAIGGFGSGPGGAGDGGKGGSGLNFFGVRDNKQTGLVGTFYDLKQNQSRQPTGMDFGKYSDTLKQFVRANFSDGIFGRFYRAPKPIYATQIFTPNIPAEMGPAAFGVEKEVQPRLWMVHYKGKVVAPESGTFQFSGVGDDVLLVKFNGRWVLDSCWCALDLGLQGQTFYKWAWQNPPRGVALGVPFTVEAGKAYDIDVLIGEQPGIASCAALLIKKQGQQYEKDGMGNDMVPIFRTADTPLLPPPPGNINGYAPHAEGGPIWKVYAAAKPFSVFDR